MRRTAALIVGGGPAGAAAAITLARGGATPLLLERSPAPRDVVCGGFLSGDTLARLRALGVDPFALGARPIRRLRLVWGAQAIETLLPFPAAGCSRRTLDEALLAAAVAEGAALERGVAVQRIEAETAISTAGPIAADALFVATGKHELRGLVRGKRGDAVGLRRSIVPSPALGGLDETIELHLFDGGYAGLLIQDDGTANLCLSLSRARFAAAGARPERLLASLEREAPLLVARVANAGEWSAVAGVPYGWRATATSTGVFRVGDQAAVIASLAGDGIAIALASGTAAAEAWLAGRSAPEFQRQFAARVHRPLAIASAAKTAAESPALRPLAWSALRRLPSLASSVGRLTRIG